MLQKVGASTAEFTASHLPRQLMCLQEPVLAPVTPRAGQARKERFGGLYGRAGPLAHIRSPLQDVLDEAAAAGMQAMEVAEEDAAPAQQMPVHSPLKRHLQRPSLALSPGEAGSSEGPEAAAPAMLGDQQSVQQQGSQLPEDILAEAVREYRAEAPHHSGGGADAQGHVSIERQRDATAAAVEPELAPDDDLPLTSLFADGAPHEHHSNRSTARPEGSQKPSAESAVSQQASQESNQENQEPASDAR